MEDEPAFLRGQTRLTTMHSPVKIVKNPDGSLQRAAVTQSALAKERREIRQAKRETEQESVVHNVNKSWLDPIPEGGDRYFAQDLRNTGTEYLDHSRYIIYLMQNTYYNLSKALQSKFVRIIRNSY